MPNAMYVLGHKNPDSDSICAALGYAALLHLQGQADAVAARQGPVRRETAYILDRFGVGAPLLVTDVRPRVADVMTSPAITVHEETSLLEVGQLMQNQGIRAAPVVDETGRLFGVVGIEDFARNFIAGLDLDQLDHVVLDVDNLLRALGGTLLVRAEGRTLRDRVMVGAMELDSMLSRLAPDILMVMGDRTDAQRAAIEFGVGALVITGDHPVTEEILQLARRRQVTLISVPHHTYTTVRLIHLSTAVRHVMRTTVVTCHPEDLVEEIQETLRAGQVRALVVVDDDQHVVGLISRSNLLRTIRRRIILVDHNERGQAVPGIEEADVVGVIDHHRVADFQTRTPPFMRLEPVGATSTIVAKLFGEAGIPLAPAMAGVLLGGILADTLLLHGPTTTAEDRRIATELAARAGVDLQELGTQILDLASDVADRSAEQLLLNDFKEFTVGTHRFGIGTIETTNGAAVLNRRARLQVALAAQRARGYTSVWFAVIDIVAERTTLLVDGYPEAVARAFDAELTADQTIERPGILSRKKHLVPVLTAISRAIPAG
ncbi:MAG TPA: putative manganese-dependent inorganic diphosphatase [Chloroflexia bacterium]|nr:putative manganese-dependent inorganic diphosphatase [Chloroflexia bacterium]